MRAEMKIGIAVGVVIAVVAVLYVVFHESFSKPPPSGPQAGKVSPSATPHRGTQAPAGGAETLVPTFGGRQGEAEPVTPTVAELAPGTETVAPAPVPPIPPAATEPAVAAEATRAESPLAPRIAPPAGVRPGAPTGLPAASRGTTTYVVKKGDKGFWDVAVKVYGSGKGKYWPLIEKANRQISYTGLKEGMTLVIPPLPDQPAGPATVVTPSTPTAGAGEKVYTVQPNDGWWKIALKEYGDGKYWEQLRKANPQIEGALKVGQKIRIPPLDKLSSTSPATVPAAPARPASQPAPAPTYDRPMFD
jgi:nucleoid-associated protein YgaU